MNKNINKKEKAYVLKNNFKILKLVFNICPSLIPSAIIYIIAFVLINLLRVFLISYSIKLVLSGGLFIDILKGILFVTILEVICLFFKVLYEDYLEPKLRNKYLKNIQTILYSKVKNIDLEEYDNPEFYSKYSRALRDSQYRGFRVYRTMIDFIKSVICAFALGIYTIIIDPLIVVLSILVAIVSVISLNMVYKLYYKLFKETEKEERFYWYVNRVFYDHKYSSEIKTTSVSNILIKKYSDSVDKKEEKYIKANMKMIGPKFMFNAVESLVLYGVTFIYLGYKLFNNLITVAIFSSTINANIAFFNNFMNASSIIADLKEHARYINDFLWIMNYNPVHEKEDGNLSSSFESIKLNNVTFKYKGTDKTILNDFSFTLKKGEKIAIVGENGTGKTTLIKLLLSFYNVSSGSISFNDTPYESLNLKGLRKHFASVFQDFNIYALPVIENVLMRKPNGKLDEERVLLALEKVGLKEKVLNSKNGLYTTVTKEFDEFGLELSGGERQRLAIARVFASDADIYILDEPTASLDPFAEEKINKLLLDIARDKTIIIIAHRLSSVVDLDKIYLMKDGSFKEVGTHEELLKLNKDYALMFNTQKHLYEKQ